MFTKRSILLVAIIISPLLSVTGTVEEDSTTIKRVIIAGNYPITCTLDSGGTEGTAPGRGKSYEIYTDSLGRKIMEKATQSGRTTSSKYTMSRAIDSEGRIIEEYRCSESSASTRSSKIIDTLYGNDWNNSGMITKGVLNHRSIQYGGGPEITKHIISNVDINYDTSEISGAVTSILDTFEVDTVLIAGDCAVPCKIVKYSGKGGTSWISTGTEIYFDHLGRIIQKEQKTTNSQSGTETHSSYVIALDSSSNVVSTNFEYQGSYLSRSILIGHSWNDKGMIIGGTLMKTDSTDLADTVLSSFNDDFNVSILYDSTGVEAIDTIFHNKQAVSIEKDAIVNRRVTLRNDNKIITLKGIRRGTKMRLVSANGRVILNAVSSANNVVQINMKQLPSGIYFFVSPQNTFKIFNN